MAVKVRWLMGAISKGYEHKFSKCWHQRETFWNMKEQTSRDVLCIYGCATALQGSSTLIHFFEQGIHFYISMCWFIVGKFERSKVEKYVMSLISNIPISITFRESALPLLKGPDDAMEKGRCWLLLGMTKPFGHDDLRTNNGAQRNTKCTNSMYHTHLWMYLNHRMF